MSTHLRLLSFLGPYKKQVFFAWFVVAMAAITTMVMPQLVSCAVDTGLKPPTFKDAGAEVAENVGHDDTQVVLSGSIDVQPGERIRSSSEQLLVTAVDGNTLTVERGAEGTRVRPHRRRARRSELVDRATFEGKTQRWRWPRAC